jgi:hypothetical protein
MKRGNRLPMGPLAQRDMEIEHAMVMSKPEWVRRLEGMR